jgi:syntaxin 1B/2/3
MLQMLYGDRLDSAQTALNANRKRTEVFQKIEKDFVWITTMFTDVDNVVVQHESGVETIDQGGEEVKTNTGQANVELTGATDKANAARRKRWWCLGIAGESPLATQQEKLY